jgi:hypothetical protein
MEKMLIRGRWMALPWGVYLLVIALILGGGGIYGHIYYPDEKPSVRAVVPAYGLTLYVVFALLFNWRTSVVTPNGLTVSVWPLVVRPPRRLQRDKIRGCFIRSVSTRDDGTLIESYFSVGVESMEGRQIEISYPHQSASEAMQLANEIARQLNQSPGGRLIEVQEVEQLQSPAEALATVGLVGFWLILFIAAILAGFAWEARG